MFNTYDELVAAVTERRKDQLVLEVDLGNVYSPEYEAAKEELKKAEALKLLAGGQGFLDDNTATLEAKVAELRPESQSVWLKFNRVPLNTWSLLMKTGANLTPLEQYAKLLPETFAGLYGSEDATEPLTTDPAVVSPTDSSILPGGTLYQVVGTFMAWQNSSGEVTIRPTRSGHVSP